jgi:hypothetical protein
VGKYENYKTNLGLISCDKGIIPQEYDNVPTEGFVLNKKLVVGQVVGIIGQHIVGYMTWF